MTKVTIIIPTYNRPVRLRRLLDYYNSYKVDYDIIVADSSFDKNKALNKETVFSFPNLKILYLDYYSDKINGLYKIIDAINYAKSEYSLFCADDDFITPNGIKQSVDFLEKNLDFTLAHGRYIDFWLKAKKRREKQFFYGIRYTNQSIIFSDPKIRLIEYLSKYSQSTIYGVHRTDFLKMIYKELLKSKVDPLLFEELLLTMLTLIYGKMKCLDILYAARELISNSAGATSKTVRDFINEGSYNEKYTKFRNCLAAHLSKKSQLNIEESKKVINDAMSMYIKKDHSPNLKRALRNKTKYILNSLHIPDWIYEKLRLLHKKLFLSSQMNTFFVSLNNPSSKYYKDFDKIRSQVISYES